jgi:hypothetical protein
VRSVTKLLLLLFISAATHAQTLTREAWSTYACEDLSDWIRRLPGMYPVDYGVAGAPIVFRPWGMHPWNVGVTRDGIPWNRVSDGLYDSNLDSPDELESLSLDYLGLDPMATLVMKTRELPADTPLTEISLREGYYGFGRVDFAHAQRFTPRMTVEGRGRLFWYDGLRFEISKSRFYNMSGKLRYAFSDAWQGSFEYGGANADAQSPHIYRPSPNVIQRPQEYSEREYGTLRLKRQAQKTSLEFGMHARQDRMTRDVLFGMREQFWYGYAEGRVHNAVSSLGTKVSIEKADMTFPGQARVRYFEPRVEMNGNLDLVGLELAAGGYASKSREEFENSPSEDYIDSWGYGHIGTPSLATFRGVVNLSGGAQKTPVFWRTASYSVTDYPLFVSDLLTNLAQRFEGQGHDVTIEALNWRAGLETKTSSRQAGVYWFEHRGDDGAFHDFGEFVSFDKSVSTDRQSGLQLDGTTALLGPLSMQTMSSLQLDPEDISRATELRSFTRLNFSKDFFKAPLHVSSYVAYEHIGRHDAVSEFGKATLGPAHLVHFRVEGTIEGVTLIWGAENLTGQHYEYLPGYMLIRKEEYFGLKWTLKL